MGDDPAGARHGAAGGGISGFWARLFEYLRSCLARDESALPYAEIAARLNLTEAAVKMAIHRLRARYREILLAEIADTVSSPEEVEEEIRHLFSTFGP